MMELIINGEARQLPVGITAAGLMETLKIAPTQVAVERNGAIVPRSTWERTLLQEGDRIEIVKFIGGG